MLRSIPREALRELLPCMPDGALLVATDGTIVQANSLVEQLFGYGPGELQSRPMALLVPERLREAHARHVSHYSRDPVVRRMGAGLDLIGLRNDGAEIPVEISLYPVESTEGRFTLVAFRDISQSEARYRAVFEQVGVGVVHSNREGRFLNVNPKFCDISGYTRAEALTLGIEDLAHPDDLGPALEARSQLFAGGGASSSERDARLVRKDGNVLWTHITTSLVRGTTGDPLHFITVIQDISAQKRAADERRESERRFSHLLQNVELVALMLDRDARITYCNDYLLHLTGWSREAVVGRNWFDSFLPPETAPGMREVFQSLLADIPEAWHHENEILTRLGERRLVRWNNSVLRSVDGDVIGIATIGEDITEQHAAQERIRRLNRVYAVLSDINALIVRAPDRQQLLREACRIAVDEGGFSLAWAALVDPVTMALRPVAWEGVSEDLVLRIARAASAPDGQGPVAKAIRERKPAIVNDLEDESTIVEKAATLALGTRAIVALPLVVGDAAVGVLSLHSREPDVVDDEELKLLLELAGDISFALDHLEKADRVTYLALHDSLTGLPNRTQFAGHIEQAIAAAAERANGGHLAVIVFDLERFRAINATLGRQAGDELLTQVAARARADAPEGGASLARTGPDQFAFVLAAGGASEVIARRIESRRQQLLGAPFPLSGTDVRVSAKMGIAVYPDDGTDADVLLRNAEAAVSNAKASGDRYLFFTREMTTRAAENLALENQLRAALEHHEFVLHYQARIELRTMQMKGVEALLRWEHRDGLVPPSRFIALMEETGLILEAGRWALSQAVADHARWTALGLPDVRVAVNISSLQLRQRGFVAELREALARGTDPPGIDLEITESLVMESIEENIDTLKAIRDLGVNIAIDDFGTGYSSLAYLARLPVASLKIDRVFISSMLDDPNAMSLVQTVISLAHSLRLKVIAEGVESEDQAKVLRLLRCDEIQGFLFSRPVPFEEMTALLQSRP